MTVIWVTKHALTRGRGIEKIEHAEIHDGSMVAYTAPSLRGDYYVHGHDWHRTEVAAIARANEMRLKKIASLKKQIERLEKLNFS